MTKDHIIQFYQELFSSLHIDGSSDVFIIDVVIPCLVTNKENGTLTAILNSDEVKIMAFDMDRLVAQMVSVVLSLMWHKNVVMWQKRTVTWRSCT